MADAARTSRRAELGDFQTPGALARDCCAWLAREGITPAAIVEPTCGRGAFLAAALDALPSARRALGVDRSPAYLAQAAATLRGDTRCALLASDFFATDWPRLLAVLPDPLLIIGNPPWVTNAALGRLASTNRPPRANTDGASGIEALTGRSNFDISQWMLERALEWMEGREATLAVLCKTAVARRLLAHAWQRGAALGPARLHAIDAAAHFGASVDAGFLVVSTARAAPARECSVHAALGGEVRHRFGLRSGKLVSDVRAHAQGSHLAADRGDAQPWRWRSGIKHDCAPVMELRKSGEILVNGLGEPVDVEPEHLYPLCKSAQLGGDGPNKGGGGDRRFVLVPQRAVGDDTARLEQSAPRTWAYLCAHGARLDARRSRIYRGRARFAVFGVGPYSFAPFKLAISGLYKRLRFRVLGPVDGRPVLLDDTGYALACQSEAEAKLLLRLLESEPAQQFLAARVFWDAKRPITANLLGQLDLAKLAAELGCAQELARFAQDRDVRPQDSQP